MTYEKRGVSFFITRGAKKIVKKMYKKEYVENEVSTRIKKMKLFDIEIDNLKTRLENRWDKI